MSLSLILGQTWYPKFLPKNVKKFKIFGWKVETINAGETPGKQLRLKRIFDGKIYTASFSELEKNMVAEKDYISEMKKFNFNLTTKVVNQLCFSRENSNS